MTKAKDVGLAVPATVWTNDVDDVARLATTNKWIVKTVTAAHWENDEETAFVFAHAFSNTDLPSDSAEFTAAPTAFQARIEPKRDIRVTVVGDRAFAAETVTDSLDWRVEPKTSWRPHELPPDIAGKCTSLAASLNLQFGGIDLVLDSTGTYWFLEINPNGEWAWLQACGLPISSALADLLTNVQ